MRRRSRPSAVLQQPGSSSKSAARGQSQIKSKGTQKSSSDTFSVDAASKHNKRARARVEASSYSHDKGKGRQDQEDGDRPRFKTIGQGGEGESSEDDDDESIASSEADTSGNDEPAPKRRKGPALSKPRAIPSHMEIDLDEGTATPSGSRSTFDSEEEEGAKEDGVEISEMLNGAAIPESESEESDEEALPSSDDDESDDNADAEGKLRTLVSNLAKDTSNLDPRKRRRILPEKEYNGEESEFAALPGRKLKLDDLLAGLDPIQSAALKKSTKALREKTGKSSASGETNIFKIDGPLPAPLDSRKQAKIDRSAAREKLYEEADRWNDTVRQMKGIGSKESEFGNHRLHLPTSSAVDHSKVTVDELASRFAPKTSVEQQIAAILDASQGGSTKSQVKAEDAALQSLALNSEQHAARVAQLKMQRDLLFRAERKARRVNKIKSKAFKRLARKTRIKQGNAESLNLEEMEQLDELDGGHRAAEEKERLQALRAKERVSLRHASGKHASRWTAQAASLKGLDDAAAQDARDRLAREQALRRKITGSAEESEASDASPSLNEEDEDVIKQSAFDEVALFDAQEAALLEKARPNGLMGMKFMQNALAAKQRGADAEASAMFREEESDDPDGQTAAATVVANPGRRVFAPTQKKTATTEAAVVPVFSSADFVELEAEEDDEQSRQNTSNANPWLAETGPASKMAKKSSNGTPATSATKVALKAAKTKSRSKDALQARKEESNVLVDPTSFLSGKKIKQSAKPNASLTNDKAAESESDADESQAIGFKQQDLVARAFADDNVVAEFEAEKKRVIDSDAPQDVDETIPGWGSWGGKGVRKTKASKKFIKHLPGINASERKDADLPHVIINEKRDRKAAKYLVKDLPFPFTDANQHEQSLSQPMGAEWQTLSAQRSLTRPDILTRAGVIINPASLAV